MHENGLYKVTSNIIHDEECINCMTNPSMVIDLSCGVILKIGDRYKSKIKDYFLLCSQKISKKDIFLLEFDEYSNILSLDEICTLMNYMQNTIGEKEMKSLLSMSGDLLKQKINKLTSYGF